MKVAICGAGISGLALAHRMRAHGCDVVVLERAPGPRRQGLYMIDFFGPGFDAAEAMGLLRGCASAPTRSTRPPTLEAELRALLPDQVELRYGTHHSGGSFASMSRRCRRAQAGHGQPSRPSGSCSRTQAMALAAAGSRGAPQCRQVCTRTACRLAHGPAA